MTNMNLKFKIEIPNIFKKNTDETISGKDWYSKLPFDRSVEINYGRINDSLITFDISVLFSGRDHAGPEFELSVLGHGVKIELPKNRHWNYEKDCWLEKYNDWIKKVEYIFHENERFNDIDFDKLDFNHYYEQGSTPEEAIEDFYEEHCLSIETYNNYNNPE